MSSTPVNPQDPFDLGKAQGRTEATLEGLATSVDRILTVIGGVEGRTGLIDDVNSLKGFRRQVVSYAKWVGGVVAALTVAAISAFLGIGGTSK